MCAILAHAYDTSLLLIIFNSCITILKLLFWGDFYHIFSWLATVKNNVGIPWYASDFG